MPKIDFYILSETNPDARLQFACRLIEKAYKQKHIIYIHAEDRAMANQLDEMLWTYRDDSFLPHNLYGNAFSPPIQIGFDAVPKQHCDILINLHNQVPEFHHQFARILELIANDPASQEAGRARFRFYRTHHFEMKSHQL